MSAPAEVVAAFLAAVRDDPVVASVKDDAGLRRVLRSDREVVFLLYGDLLALPGLVARLKDAGKTVLVDVDLVDGLSAHDAVAAWVRRATRADGVLSSKAGVLRAASSQGLLTVHRLFLIDSFSYRSAPKQLAASRADVAEVLPGCIPRVIEWLRADVDLPLIAGGLVCDKRDVLAALAAGAVAVASSDPAVWAM